MIFYLAQTINWFDVVIFLFQKKNAGFKHAISHPRADNKVKLIKILRVTQQYAIKTRISIKQTLNISFFESLYSRMYLYL